MSDTDRITWVVKIAIAMHEKIGFGHLNPNLIERVLKLSSRDQELLDENLDKVLDYIHELSQE